MPIEKLRPSFTLDEDRFKDLCKILPEAIADGKVNWEVLREALAGHLEGEKEEVEHFGLFWPGKLEARRLTSTQSTGTLFPVFGEGLKPDGSPDTDRTNTSHNIFIEGENLEVLKILQKSYAGQIKMIYIDPPYNTGNDFIYDDDFTESLKEYLKRARQIDEEGNYLTTNKKGDGRFHSKWLSMMYPRLRLARNLLTEDGVVFISIDDNEIHNLKLLMNEIFGEENFVAMVIVQTNPRGRTLDKYIAKTHEYILIFAKDIDEKGINFIRKSEKARADYNLSDENGNYRLLELRNRNPVFNRTNRPKLFYPLYFNEESGNVSLEKDDNFNIEVFPINSKNEDGCWTWGQTKALKFRNLLVGKKVGTGALRIFRKDYLAGSSEFTKDKSVWLESNLNHENGKEVINKLFGYSPFDFPKSPELIKKCINLGTSAANEEIVLDFFGGSGTTAHSVFMKNLEDSGDRKFIINQIDFKVESDKNYKTISEIAIDRIRKVSHSIKKGKELDFGFKVFKLNQSNFLPWQNYSGTEINKLELQFENQVTHLVNNWSVENLISEILLLEGFPLDSEIEKMNDFKHNSVFQILSNFCIHKLIICLDATLHFSTIENMKLNSDDVFVCLDSAIPDKYKLSLSDKGIIKTI